MLTLGHPQSWLALWDSMSGIAWHGIDMCLYDPHHYIIYVGNGNYGWLYYRTIFNMMFTYSMGISFLFSFIAWFIACMHPFLTMEGGLRGGPSSLENELIPYISTYSFIFLICLHLLIICLHVYYLYFDPLSHFIWAPFFVSLLGQPPHQYLLLLLHLYILILISAAWQPCCLVLRVTRVLLGCCYFIFYIPGSYIYSLKSTSFVL